MELAAIAEHVFLARGFVDTTMQMIASQAGGSKETLYRHFRSKEALFAEVVGRRAAQISGPETALARDEAPEVALFETVPVVRLMGPNGPQLVNARQYLNVVILDQLVGRAELRVGLGEHAETVTITRGTLRTISCPGDEACPVWPKAATELARRHP